MSQKIRIGNDINITWSVLKKDKTPYPINSEVLDVYMVVNHCKVDVDSITVSGNTITFTFYGRDQLRTGSYALMLVENKGNENMITHDVKDAFALVPHSWQEEYDSEPENVFVESVLNNDIIIPDEETITSDQHTGVISLKNRTYDESEPNVLGYKILAKDIPFAEQVTAANTIYEIRYDYNLNNTSVTIPAGCVLKFDGGLLRDGTLVCDDLKIEADKKCLDTITFGGQFQMSGTVRLTWYIDKFSENVSDTTVDNTADVQFVMNLGVKNVEFPVDKYVRLTQTIIVPTATSILASHSEKRFPESMSTGTGYKQPCVFSKSVVTLFNYQIEGFGDTTGIPFTIGAITLYVDVPYEDLSDKLTPILQIETNGATALSSTYGVNLECNIVSIRNSVTIDGHTDALLNYTGIYINAKSGPLTFIKINGNIFGTYYGIVTDSIVINDGVDEPGSWITDITVNGNTWCSYGGWFKVGSPVFVFGSHQTHPTDNTQEQKEGYFYGESIFLYGKVWDCGAVSSRGYFVRASYPVKLYDNGRNSMLEVRNDGGRVMPRVNYYGNNFNLYTNPIENSAFPVNNALRLALRSSGYSPVSNLTYEINGTNILVDNNIVQNSDNLFNENVIGSTALANTRAFYSWAYVSDGLSSCNITFEIDRNLLISGAENGIPLLFYRLYERTHKTTLTIEHKSTSAGTYALAKQSIFNGFYYTASSRVFNLSEYGRYVRITINITNNLTPSESGYRNWFILPTIIIPAYSSISNELSFTSALRPTLNSYRKGFVGFDETIKKQISWDGTQWRDGSGFTAAPTRGASSGRPIGEHLENGETVGILKSTDVGFEYFDTTLNKKIYAVDIDGSTGVVRWVEVDGAVAGTLRSGSVLQLPPFGDIYNGFAFECLDLKKTAFAKDRTVVFSKDFSSAGYVTIDNVFSENETFEAYMATSYGYLELYSSTDGETNVSRVWRTHEAGVSRGSTGVSNVTYPYLRVRATVGIGVAVIFKFLAQPKWIDSNGFTLALDRGATADIPTSSLTADDAGFEYFDTTRGKPIWWNGTAWVDSTGASV